MSENLVNKYKNNKKELYLSFCLPKIEKPSMKIMFDFNLIESLQVNYFIFSYNQPTNVENKPEAPWIKRNNGTIYKLINL